MAKNPLANLPFLVGPLIDCFVFRPEIASFTRDVMKSRCVGPSEVLLALHSIKWPAVATVFCAFVS